MTVMQKDNYRIWGNEEINEIKKAIMNSNFKSDQEACEYLSKKLGRNISAVRSKFSKIKKELLPDQQSYTWTDEEVDLLKDTITQQYYKTDKEAIQAIADVTGRTFNAVNYKFYEIKKQMNADKPYSKSSPAKMPKVKDRSDQNMVVSEQIDEAIEDLEILKANIDKVIANLKDAKKSSVNIESWITETLRLKNRLYTYMDNHGVVEKVERK